MRKRLLIATRNAHKTAEFREMLGDRFEIEDLLTHPEIGEIDETGATFRENAELKALAAAHAFDGLVLADDSGLEVDALDGAPGVRSARYAGENATDAMNRDKLLAELSTAGARGRQRSARFRCVLVLAERGRVLATFDGTVEGTIINQPKGANGFGYDPLFVPEGWCETFAELTPEVKHRESHRARALSKLCTYLEAQASAPE